MKTPPAETSQTMQRIRVAMTGLAAVLVLIGLTSSLFSYVNKEPPVAAIGASKADVVANITDTQVANLSANEPLAEMGVAPVATANISQTDGR